MTILHKQLQGKNVSPTYRGYGNGTPWAMFLKPNKNTDKGY